MMVSYLYHIGSAQAPRPLISTTLFILSSVTDLLKSEMRGDSLWMYMARSGFAGFKLGPDSREK